MDAQLEFRRVETAAHARRKRLALIWAQAERYTICAPEVRLPKCRFRAAVFECKQSPADLRRDNCESLAEMRRLETLVRRRQILERNLRIHYPSLRRGESLFADYDVFDFESLHHCAHRQVVAECTSLQQRLRISTKFETMARYRCANLLYLVIPQQLFHEVCAPAGWGVLLEQSAALELVRPPVWHDVPTGARDLFLEQVGRAATRAVNRQFKIQSGEVEAYRKNSQKTIHSSQPA